MTLSWCAVNKFEFGGVLYTKSYFHSVMWTISLKKKRHAEKHRMTRHKCTIPFLLVFLYFPDPSTLYVLDFFFRKKFNLLLDAEHGAPFTRPAMEDDARASIL